MCLQRRHRLHRALECVLVLLSQCHRRRRLQAEKRSTTPCASDVAHGLVAAMYAWTACVSFLTTRQTGEPAW